MAVLILPARRDGGDGSVVNDKDGDDRTAVDHVDELQVGEVLGESGVIGVRVKDLLDMPQSRRRGEEG
ncbi:hypothetical protein BHE74_00014984 [Ensete ventricosum]|nr:hypothetical protein GW17_00047370 [Ensete ventricosum]RWW76891.1 hypothetical protein BHE74_00014984 [Ensete ventricosum]RZR85906.1 hypothetical protein BHM03_00012968 [Ensete ventricosum]